MERFSTTTNREILAGIFTNEESATKALNDLKKSGYSTDEINVVMSKDTKTKYLGKRKTFDRKQRGLLNAWTTKAELAGFGPMLSALDGLGHMSEKAGIRAALICAGIPAEQAGRCNEGLKNGKILLTINPKNEHDFDYISYKWNKYRAEEVYS